MPEIVSARYQSDGSIRVLFDDETESVVNDTDRRTLWRRVTDWVALGNTIAEYSKPSPTDADVDAERDQRIALGFIVTLESGSSIPVQTRSLIDFRNITGLSTSAMALKISGSDDLMNFRDALDTTHELTLDDAIDLGLKVSSSVQAVYAAAWSLKALTDIPEDYTDDAYWPSREGVIE